MSKEGIALSKLITNQKGTALIIVAFGMIAIFGTAAIVVDIGMLLIEKNKLEKTADAAVLAGALELPNAPDHAVSIALNYIEKNSFSQEDATVSVLDTNHALQVTINHNTHFKFAPLLGFENKQIQVSSKAIIGSVSAVYEGIRPFVVEQQSFTYGQQVVLKEEGGDGYHGNYGAIALSGTGASVFEDNIKHGFEGKLQVGNYIDTEPGNMAGPTLDGVDYIINGVEDIIQGDDSTFNHYTPDSRRLWTIPIVDSLAVEGRSTVEIVGFALFFLEDVEKVSGQAEITGRFIEFVTNGDISQSQPNYGLYGVKLVQ